LPPSSTSPFLSFPHPPITKTATVAASLGSSSAKAAKIRRKSDPAFHWRNANAVKLATMHGQQQQQQQQQQSAVGTSSSEYSTATAEQLIRKWSTKSNSSNAGDQLRTLREQLGITGAKGGAGYAMAKGR
jgi:hypothetical protein